MFFNFDKELLHILFEGKLPCTIKVESLTKNAWKLEKEKNKISSKLGKLSSRYIIKMIISIIKDKKVPIHLIELLLNNLLSILLKWDSKDIILLFILISKDLTNKCTYFIDYTRFLEDIIKVILDPSHSLYSKLRLF